MYRVIDFKRDKIGAEGKVQAIEYDPNRSARIALVKYSDGEVRYILAPDSLKVGSFIMSSDDADIQSGNTLPIGKIPLGAFMLNVCRATIGVVSNLEHENISIGKAGRTRWLGIRPHVRGVAMNPIDHPMGGGEGKTSGGGHPVSPWGIPTKGYKTRKKKNSSNKLIVKRRK